MDTLNLSETFKSLGKLVSKQKDVTANFNANSAYGENENSDFNSVAIKLFYLTYENMGLGQAEELKDWKFNLKMKSKDLIDHEHLFTLLRKLPSDEVKKIRIFNRIVGQQQLVTTVSDLFQLQERKMGEWVNPFYDAFCTQIQSFASIFGKTLVAPKWPKEKLNGVERESFMKNIEAWRQEWLILPGFKLAKTFFEEQASEVFSAFFHIQRQFDSDNARDFDKDNQPYPQPLPKIFAYRKAISGMSQEFDNAEASITMCFDYCRMNKDRVISFVLDAENAFLNIVTRLEDQYPIDLDNAHFKLHEQSHKVKLMMFPLRCLFFDELEAHRGVKDSNDQTLDSYMDMTLVENTIHLPASYIHHTSIDVLEPELQKALKALFNDTALTKVESKELITRIQAMTQSKLEEHAKIFDGLCNIYEVKYKSEEENLSRRLSRLAYLYLKAMEKKSAMKSASQERLNSIKAMADKYAKQAERFAQVDIGDENTNVASVCGFK